MPVSRKSDRRLAAIFVVDVVGHSRLMSENEAATAMMQPQITVAQRHRRDAGGKPKWLLNQCLPRYLVGKPSDIRVRGSRD
jgi:hypothetical protein